MVHKAMLKRTMSSLSIKFVRFMRSLRERTGMHIIYSDNHLVLRNRSGFKVSSAFDFVPSFIIVWVFTSFLVAERG